MHRLAKVLSRKQLQRPLYIILCISLACLLTITFFAPSVIAWFKSYTVVKNDGQLTNFITKTEYSLNGSSWSVVDSDTPISVKAENVSKLQIRVSYAGIHQAYLRVKLHGDYVNRHSGTHLSSSSDVFIPNSSDQWASADGYLYYKSVLGMSSETGSEATTTQTLDPFTVSSSLPDHASEYQEYNTELYVIVDAVQTDRYDELWSLSQLPF